MKRAIVLYHSLYGNTKVVATSLAKGIKEIGIETDCLSIDEIDIEQIPSYDFVAIGSPTHMIRPSKDMKEFLQRLKSLDLRGRTGFAFDTRNHSRMNNRSWLMLENSAARSIEGAMKRMKIKILASRESAIVEGREGPLDMGIEDRFTEVGRELGRLLASQILPQKFNE
ncbi:MAG: flavodoxin family protein [Candidatus Thorarchaeota archaeon]|jgi:flavodoxin